MKTPGAAGRLFVIALVALVVKGATLYALHDHPLLQPRGGLDTSFYIAFAERVASGDLALGNEPFFLSPLYIYFLALSLSVGPLLFARILQLLLGVATVVLVSDTARQWFGMRAQWFTATVALATGITTFYELTILPAALDPFLTALVLWLLCKALKSERSLTFFGCGTSLGLLVLNRPNVLLWIPILLLMLAVSRRFVPLVMLSVGLVVAIAPVSIRNYVVSGELVLISSHGGLNFYIGNNGTADGTYHHVPGIRPDIRGQQIDSRRMVEGELGRRASTVEVSQHFYRKSFQWITEQPAVAIALFCRKVLYTLNATDLSLNYSYTFFSRDVRSPLQLLLVGPWLLIPLGLLGLLLRLSSGRDISFLTWASFIPLYILSVALFFVSGRYRLPLLIPMMITTGFAFEWIIQKFTLKQYRVLTRWSAVLAIVCAACWFDFGLDDGRSNERTAMALYFIENDRYAEASRLMEQTLEEHPQPALLHYRLGHAFHARHRFAEAIDSYNQALAADPGEVEIRSSLGRTLVAAGRTAEAIPHLQAAFEAGLPHEPGLHLARALGQSGNADETLTVLRTLRPPASASASDLTELGRRAVEIGEPSVATPLLEKAVRRDPKYAAAHHWLGMSFALQGKDDDAIQSLETSLRLHGRDPVTHLNLAVLYAKRSRNVEARQHAIIALDLRPGYENATRLLDALEKLE